MAGAFSNGARISLGLIVALLTLGAGLAYWSTRQIVQDAQWVGHTHEAIHALDDLVSTLKDAETGQRGYLITGDARYLEPYHEAVADIGQKIQRVKQLTADNPEQQARIPPLEEAIARRLAQLERNAALRKENVEAAQQAVSTDGGRALMDGIQAQVDQMEREEAVLLRDRQQQTRRSYYAAVTTVLITALLGLVMVGAFAEGLRRHLLAGARGEREREELLANLQSERERLQDLNETLEARVVERTAVAEKRANQLRALASELSQAEQRERRRLAQVLHDNLQQILVAAEMKLTRLKRRVGDESKERLVEEVKELLDDSIAQSRSLTLELSPPVLYDAGLVGGLKWLARQMEEKHRLAVEVHADPAAEPTDEGIRVFLFQAARELLFNAAKYAGTDRAWVRMSTNGRETRIEVCDQGRGFSPSSRYSLAGGFGLFSIRERLEQLGGRMEVETAPGRGTRVVLTVPRQARPPASPKRVTVPGKAASKRGNGRLRVLLADDHPILRKGLADVLREEPEIEIVGEAGDGGEALELAEEVAPDVIVMDVTMPRVDGIEATRRIKAELPQIRVIGLSMHEASDMADAMRQAGAEAYLRKDVPADELIETILGAHAPN